ncbi:MAG: hypothetical protein Q8S73_00215 [Deltaproteobacteria bacterium]|nr:hypothetical protein [Myxococcales bacterium]MDP3212495.1 hypothetical protein [Deltaproteobacteria bacterium]
MAARQVKTVCAVCKTHEGPMVRWRSRVWLCTTHGNVAQWIIPAPTSVDDLRGLFPAKVTGPKRSRAA